MNSARPDILRQTAPMPPTDFRLILGMRIAATTYSDATKRILSWALSRESRYVCVANVHMTMESHDSSDFRQIVNGADLVTPDGMPLVWMMRLLGVPAASRVYGPRLTLSLLAQAEADGVAVGFFGGSRSVLRALVQRCEQRFPKLHIAYAESPPYRLLDATEDHCVINAVNESGAAILFVGLGCPKQERWMASHKDAVNSVMVGVGAAFDFIAGAKPTAPSWMQTAGLEWLFRMASEPRRLWRRYAYHNPRFVVLIAMQLFRSRLR